MTELKNRNSTKRRNEKVSVNIRINENAMAK